ncbi:hypothetical protein Nmel_000528 [Mimus melanotis]
MSDTQHSPGGLAKNQPRGPEGGKDLWPIVQLTEGFHQVIEQPTSPSKSPSKFLDQLKDTMLHHTSLEPKSKVKIQQLINLFLEQSTSDIKHKLQNLQKENKKT